MAHESGRAFTQNAEGRPRPGEASNARWRNLDRTRRPLWRLTLEELDLVTGQLVVRRTLWRDQEGTPKGGRTREVPLSLTHGV
ncbi:MAG TPA: hypothetical protein VF912_08540 [Anaeromyxobacter sp.]